jgi:hypothetical protein
LRHSSNVSRARLDAGKAGLPRVIIEAATLAGLLGHAMFRLLYLVVLLAGLAWIIQTRPIWLEPGRAAEAVPRVAPGEAAWEQDETARMNERFRRIKIVAVATVGVVLGGEIWCLVAGRVRRLFKT